MKNFLNLIFVLFFLNASSQVNPTLGIGLEALTMNKGTIDVEVLTKIIVEKQKELKQEALKRFMFKMFPENNYSTKFYVQNCLNILLNEKNPKVIQKEILELTTNYALALGTTQALIKSNDNVIFNDLNIAYKEINSKIINFDLVVNNLREEEFKNVKIVKLEKEIILYKNFLEFLILCKKNDEKAKTRRDTLRKNLTEMIKNTDESKIDVKIITKTNNKLKRKLKHLSNFKYRNHINEIESNANKINTLNNNKSTLDVPFGMLLDAVSLSLSNNENLTKRGFFKNPINYRSENLYPAYTQQLDKLQEEITKKTSPYIKDYDLIREYIKIRKDNTDNIENIKDILKKRSFEQTEKYFQSKNKDEKWLETLMFGEKNDDVIKAVNKLKEQRAEISKIEQRVESKSIKVFNLRNDNVEIITLLQADTTNYKFSSNSKRESINFSTLNYETQKSVAEKISNFELTEDKDDESKAWNANIGRIKKLENNFDTIAKIQDSIKKQISKIGTLKDSLAPQITVIINKSNKFSKQFLQENISTVMKEINGISIKNNSNGYGKEIANALSKLQALVKEISYSNNLKIEKILTLDTISNNLLTQLKVFDAANDSNYNNIISSINGLIPIYKTQIFSTLEENFSYQPELASLFEFIANLDHLDHAQTYDNVINLLRDYNQKVAIDLPNGKFKESYLMFVNGMKKYTLINSQIENQYIEIDIVSFIDDLQQYYNRNNPSRFSIYFTLGLNENFFFNDFKFPDDSNKSISNIGFASEKIGIRYKLYDFKKFGDYQNVIKDDIYLNKKAPFINDFYTIIYGSGLLYTLANTSTDQNFDFPHVGIGLGLRFYNALDFNVTLGFPFVKDQNFGRNPFFGIGFDIPLGEYIEKLGNKN